MTREQAIEHGKSQLEVFGGEHREFIKLAIKALEQEPKFIAKSDGTIEQIKNCNDCVFRKEWEKIGKLLSVVLEKQTEQEPKTEHWIDTDEWRETVDGFEQWGYFRKCSKCGYVFKFLEIDNYCPNCGAKMESEE